MKQAKKALAVATSLLVATQSVTPAFAVSARNAAAGLDATNPAGPAANARVMQANQKPAPTKEAVEAARATMQQAEKKAAEAAEHVKQATEHDADAAATLKKSSRP